MSGDVVAEHIAIRDETARAAKVAVEALATFDLLDSRRMKVFVDAQRPLAYLDAVDFEAWVYALAARVIPSDSAGWGSQSSPGKSFASQDATPGPAVPGYGPYQLLLVETVCAGVRLCPFHPRSVLVSLAARAVASNSRLDISNDAYELD